MTARIDDLIVETNLQVVGTLDVAGVQSIDTTGEADITEIKDGTPGLARGVLRLDSEGKDEGDAVIRLVDFEGGHSTFLTNDGQIDVNAIVCNGGDISDANFINCNIITAGQLRGDLVRRNSAGTSLIFRQSDDASALRLTNIADPTGATDAATKGYVDAFTITAGAGLTGGGSGSAVTLDIGQGDGITVNTNDIAVNSTVLRTTGVQTITGIKTVADGIDFIFGSAENTTLTWDNANEWLDVFGRVSFETGAGDYLRVVEDNIDMRAPAGDITIAPAALITINGTNINLYATSGSVNINGSRLSAVADPTANQDATTRVYVTDGTFTFMNKTINATNNTVTDTSTAAGDLFKSNGTKFVRFARGTANQVPRVNSGGTDLEYSDVTPPSFFASATGDTVTASTSPIVVPSMTLTPGAGTYVVMFSTDHESDTNAGVNTFQIYANAVAVADAIKVIDMAAGDRQAISISTRVTVAASQAIDARWNTNTGNATAGSRSLTLIKVLA